MRLQRIRELVAAFLISGLAAAVGALALFSWLAQQIIDGESHHIDQAARDFVQRIAFPILTDAMRGFTVLGEGLQIAELLALASTLLFRAGRKRAAWLMIITMAGGLFLERLLKVLFHRTRPEPFFGTLLPSSFSFPSGHALQSCCFFGALAAMLTVREPNRGKRITIWTVAAVLVALIGFSRIYLGVHYVTDVIAGYSAAVVWVFSVRGVYQWRTRRRTQARHL
jgi:undecaprenyl-diphosphatase